MAAGATDDEIADVLLAIAPVVGLARVVCAAPDVAIALGYDIEAALEEPDDDDGFPRRLAQHAVLSAPCTVPPTLGRYCAATVPDQWDFLPGGSALADK